MHNHDDRDNFVEIKWENIKGKYKTNFEKVTSEFFDNFGTSYDFSSVMHYKADAFSSNDLDTIVPRDVIGGNDAKKALGRGESMSEGDIERINKMYDCFV